MSYLRRIMVYMFVFTFLISSNCSTTCLAKSDKDLKVYFTHDIHDYLSPTKLVEYGREIEHGGAARLATVICENKDENSIFLDAGDFSMGTLFQASYSTDAYELRTLGLCGCDVTTFGNHEFDFGAKGVASMLRAAQKSGDPLPKIVQSNIDLSGDLNEDQKDLKKAFEEYGVKENIKYISCLHESVAVAIADGYARKSKKPALIQLHSGVGLGNGIGMMYQALRGETPLIVLCGEAGLEYDAMDAQMACDLVSMAKTVTKWSSRVVDCNSILRLFRRAVKIATTPPMGPVFLSLPMDVLEMVNNENIESSVNISFLGECKSEDAKKCGKLLMNAQNPIFIIGDGISLTNSKKEIEKLAKNVGAKVFGANNSEVNFDSTHYCFESDLGHMFGTDSKVLVEDADVVLICGTYIFPEVFPIIDQVFKKGTKIIHIDTNAYEIAKNFIADICICADIKSSLKKINMWIKENSNKNQLEQVEKRKELLKTKKKDIRKKEEKQYDDNSVLSMFLKELLNKTNGDVVIFDEALTASGYLNYFFPMKKSGKVFKTRGGSLGVGISGAIGIQLADSKSLSIGFTGDGGSMYTIQALHTAKRYNIPAKFVIINNGKYKLLEDNISRYWEDIGEDEHKYPDFFELQPSVDYVKLAESMGVMAKRVQDGENVAEIVDLFVNSDNAFLIEIKN